VDYPTTKEIGRRADARRSQPLNFWIVRMRVSRLTTQDKRVVVRDSNALELPPAGG